MTFADWFKRMNAKPVKRPTFEGLFKLVAPAFAFGILVVLAVLIAFGEFDVYSIPLAIAAWLSCVGVLFVLSRIFGKLFGPWWDEYERHQAAQATTETLAETPKRSVAEPPIRLVRLIIRVAFANALVIGTLTGLILGGLLMGLVAGVGLALCATLVGSAFTCCLATDSGSRAFAGRS